MITSVCLTAPVSFEFNSLLCQRIPSVVSLRPDHGARPWGRATQEKPWGRVTQERPVSVAEMVGALRASGMPISAIAEAVRVERKTVYAWLNGVEARGDRLARIETLYRLLLQEEQGSLKWFYQYWDRTLSDGFTLRQALSAEQIEPARVQAALEALRPAVSRAMGAERRRAATQREEGPPGLLNLYLDTSVRG
jgi:hypothetical protein